MGNTIEHTHIQQLQTNNKHHKQMITCINPSQINSRSDHPHQNQKIRSGQLKRKHSLNLTAGRTNSQSKHNKYISLSKLSQHQTSILKDNSKLKRGISITANQQTSVRNTVDRFIKLQNKPTHPNNRNSIKKLPIKPRDLPRYSSTKIITNPSSLNTIPLHSPKIQSRLTQPHIRHFSSHQQQPTITIKYVIPQTMKTDNSLQNSNVTPFVCKYNGGASINNWHINPTSDSSNKKLKRVALSRSYVHQEDTQSVQNHQEFQVQKKVVNRYQKHDNDYDQKQNQKIFTDPYLMSYIKQPPQLMKLSHSKYAVAFQTSTLIDKPINLTNHNSFTSIPKQKYSIGHWLQDETLQNKVREVQSKQLIQQEQVQSKVLIEQPFRFQTATDISYEQKSDNTSFVPISTNYRRKMQQNDSQCDDLLKYCRPKINQKVLADLLRLPLKI